ncbi:MAG: DUF4981 domain-containing protein, partial [Erysipelotrichaceae bacterium]|nr:DUF4981 domain-containing protein [Erysipelotrichaceae bacterium]
YLRQQDPQRLLHYEGCWNHLTYHSCSDFTSRKNLTPEECEELLKLKPGRPFILCEYSNLLGNAAADLDKYARLEKYDLYQGGFLSGLYQQVIEGSEDGRERCGADFGVYPNSGHACAKGLLFGSRKPSPAVQAVKYHYQDFVITPGKYGVKIENNSLFTPLSNYEIRYSLHQEGKLIQQGTLEGEVLPGEQKKLFINWDKCDQESVKTVSLHLKEDTVWAKADHETAFGQHAQGAWNSPDARKSDMEIIEAPDCVTFEDQGFSACFTSKGLESVKYSGHEMLSGIPRPVFARAYTDNDEQSGFDLETSQWMSATLFSKIRKMETVINQESRYAMVSYFYEVPILTGAECRVDYFVAAPGLIGVDAALEGNQILPLVCQVGMEIPLKKQFSSWKYYGLGPMETVIDRQGGAKLDVYQTDAYQNVTPYFMPQDCGSRNGIRWMEALDANGRGMRICMLKKPLQASLLPYSFDELLKADHQWELGKNSRIYAVVSGFQTGAGGCVPGKPASENCRLSGRRIYSYSFIMASAQS